MTLTASVEPSLVETTTYGREAASIVNLFRDRRAARGEIINRMAAIRAHYRGTVALPVPELDRADEPAAVANFFTSGIDQHSMRIASVVPDPRYFSQKPGIKASDERARRKRLANRGWWDHSMMDLVIGQRARWLIAYSCSPVTIEPGYRHSSTRKIVRVPYWRTRDPLDTYPGPVRRSIDMEPPDCIFAFTLSWNDVCDQFPEKVTEFPNYKTIKRDAKIELVEYIDAECRVLVATAVQGGTSLVAEADYGRSVIHRSGGSTHTDWVVELLRLPNKAERCTAVVPGRITLDEPMGQFDGMVGLFQIQAKMMALGMNATARSIYPDTWFVHNDSGVGEIIVPADGITGQIGEVKGGQIVTVNEQPGFGWMPLVDRLAEAQRAAGYTPAEFEGRSGTNIRTGRRGDSVLSATIDFPIAEHQKILRRSMEAENSIAIAVDKGYFGRDKKSFYVSGFKGPVEYVPNDLWDFDAHEVIYPYAGVDAAGVMIETGQRLGLEMMSRRTAMENDPAIRDVDLEERRLWIEKVDRAGFTALEQMSASGEIPPTDLAFIKRQITKGDSWEDAYDKAQARAQERQAAQVPADDPAAQPGLSMPGMGAEAGGSFVEGPDPSVMSTAQLFGAIRRPAMAIGAENA